MEKRIGWRFYFITCAVILILALAGDIYIRIYLDGYPELIPDLRQKLLLAAAILIGFSGVLFLIFRQRISLPLDRLIDNLKTRMTGDLNELEPLHEPNDISPLLYSLEILLSSLQLQIQDAASERDTLLSVLNRITDGIVMINEQGDISSMNPAAEDIFNTTAEKASGRSVAEILRQHQWIELYRSCKETDLESSAMLEIPAQNIFLQGIAVSLGESLPGYTLMVFQDLSRIRRLETTRQDFISNITHELRTPLATLKALTDTLQESALDDPLASRRFLGRMETEVDALTHLVSELLELSLIESGRVPLNLQSVNPVSLLSRAYERLRAQADRDKLQIVIKEGLLLPEIQADARRIEQVLVNLLHNAIMYSEPESQIILNGRQENNSVVLSVQDFGSGIPENDLERIFERFYKIDQAWSSGGTGLGLSIAKHIIEAHQGEIWAESTLNEGSTFYLSIPIQPPESKT